MRELVALTLVPIAAAFSRFAVAQESGPAPQIEVAPVSLDLALGIRRPSPFDRPSLSADGGFVAYTIESARELPAPDRNQQSAVPAAFRGLRLFVVDTSNGAIDWSSSESTTAWAASWSPTGRIVAFYCDAGGEVGLWIHRVGETTATRLGTFVVGAFHSMRPEWTPDGTAILVPMISASEERKEPEAAAGSAGDVSSPSRVVVRVTGEERSVAADATNSDPPVVSNLGEEAPAPAAQSLIVGPPTALVAVNMANGSIESILPAGDRPEFLSAKVSAPGGFLACEQSLRAVFDGGLKVLLDLSIVRLVDRKIVHRVEGIELDVNIDPNSPTLAAMAWHPTQDRFAYLHAGTLIQVDLTRETPSVYESSLGEDGARADRIRFTPDGTTLLVSVLAAASSAEDPFLSKVLAIPTGDGSIRELATPAGVKLRGVVSANWRTAWQPEPAALLASGTDASSGETVFVRLPCDGSPARWIRKIEGSLWVVSALDSGRAVALVENATTAPDYFLLGSDLSPGMRLSHAEPLLDGVPIGPVESFSTEIESNGERRTVHAVVALPADGKPGDRFPTIVTLYPGMELSRQARNFGGGDVATIPTAVFTTRGYAVLVLDVPLAPFGVPSNPLRDIQTAVLPQIARAIELGYTDGDRVGVIGHSYGGYGAACLACGTNAFRAVVAVSGSYDLAGGYATQRSDEPETGGLPLNMEYMERHQGRMGIPLWDEPQRYLDNSPYFQADDIQAPMLFLHGRLDTTCAVGEAEKMFNARKRLGGTAQLAIYAEEGHVPNEWSPSNRLDMVTRTIAFFDRQLREQ